MVPVARGYHEGRTRATVNRSQDTSQLVAIGLMSGTSLDGIDAALIETDGKQIIDIGISHTNAYDSEFRSKLSAAVAHAGQYDEPTIDSELIRDLSVQHIQAVQQILERVPQNSKWSKPSIIGFHGHTTLHRPARQYTQQIGDAQLLADTLQIPIVSDFRKRDVTAGGQGAPLAPVFHAAMATEEPKPIVIVNIGGISNVTWIGDDESALVAFDTGPGNNLLDMWIEKNTGKRYDENGSIAERGKCNEDRLKKVLNDSYFAAPWPKSLDRSDFGLDIVKDMDLNNGAATLAELTARAIIHGIEICPQPPRSIYVSGGGRHNRYLMHRLGQLSSSPVNAIENIGWNGDSVEAQAFAYLAVRSLRGFPITFERTTGVEYPMTGGTLTKPS